MLSGCKRGGGDGRKLERIRKPGGFHFAPNAKKLSRSLKRAVIYRVSCLSPNMSCKGGRLSSRFQTSSTIIIFVFLVFYFSSHRLSPCVMKCMTYPSICLNVLIGLPELKTVSSSHVWEVHIRLNSSPLVWQLTNSPGNLFIITSFYFSFIPLGVSTELQKTCSLPFR